MARSDAISEDKCHVHFTVYFNVTLKKWDNWLMEERGTEGPKIVPLRVEAILSDDIPAVSRVTIVGVRELLCLMSHCFASLCKEYLIVIKFKTNNLTIYDKIHAHQHAHSGTGG